MMMMAVVVAAVVGVVAVAAVGVRIVGTTEVEAARAAHSWDGGRYVCGQRCGRKLGL